VEMATDVSAVIYKLSPELNVAIVHNDRLR